MGNQLVLHTQKNSVNTKININKHACMKMKNKEQKSFLDYARSFLKIWSVRRDFKEDSLKRKGLRKISIML